MKKTPTYAALATLLITLTTARVFAQNVIIVRHGEAINNTQHQYNGDVQLSKSYPLTAQGIQQAAHSGDALASAYAKNPSAAFTLAVGPFRPGKIAAVFVSPYRRTRETAQIITDKLGIRPEQIFFEPLIGEMFMGKMEGQSSKNFPYGENESDHRRAHEYQGENHEDAVRRLWIFLMKLKELDLDGDIIIVTHGTPARHLQQMGQLILGSHIPEEDFTSLKNFIFTPHLNQHLIDWATFPKPFKNAEFRVLKNLLEAIP